MVKKINYIIPVCKYLGNTPDYPYRIENLKKIFDSFLVKQEEIEIRVILIEQSLDGNTYFVGKFEYAKGIKVVELVCHYPVFNKCWLNNVAAKHAQGNHLIFAETDVCANQNYITNFFEHVRQTKLDWCIGWNRLLWMSKDNSIQRIINIKRRKGNEGGIVYFQKSFFDSIGGYNEWIEALGGPDNEIAERAVCASGAYETYSKSIYHLWHPSNLVAKKVGDMRRRNIKIYNNTKEHSQQVIDFLKANDNGCEKPLVATKSYLEIL